MKRYIDFIKESITVDEIEEILFDVIDNHDADFTKYDNYIDLFIFFGRKLDKHNLDSIYEYSKNFHESMESIKKCMERIKKIEPNIWYSISYLIEGQLYLQIDLTK